MSTLTGNQDQTEMQAYTQVVTKAWQDPAFKNQLRADAAGVLRSHGWNVDTGERFRVLEAAPDRAYLLLSKDLPEGAHGPALQAVCDRAHADAGYKERLVSDTGAVLAEAGLSAPEGVTVEVVELGDTEGYIMLPPAPEDPNIDLGDDVAGYFFFVAPIVAAFIPAAAPAAAAAAPAVAPHAFHVAPTASQQFRTNQQLYSNWMRASNHRR